MDDAKVGYCATVSQCSVERWEHFPGCGHGRGGVPVLPTQSPQVAAHQAYQGATPQGAGPARLPDLKRSQNASGRFSDGKMRKRHLKTSGGAGTSV
jgi:hypothetical protein